MNKEHRRHLLHRRRPRKRGRVVRSPALAGGVSNLSLGPNTPAERGHQLQAHYKEASQTFVRFDKSPGGLLAVIRCSPAQGGRQRFFGKGMMR
jgi:hypothetical protein